MQLRQADHERTVWVDAMCIDQSDVNERNHQVGLVERIYESASSVEICIRDSHQDFPAAMQLLSPKHGLAELLSIQNTEYQQMKHQSINQLRTLFQCNYFSRVWVIQEVLFAKTAILHVNQDKVFLKQEILDSLHQWCNQQSVAIPRLSHWVSIWRRDGGIVSCLSMSLNCSASDPRDKIFAIASLLRPNVRELISIDYQSTLQAVYADAVAACIVEYGDLDILGFADVPSNIHVFTTSTFDVDDFKTFLAQRTMDKAPSSSMARMCSPWTSRIVVKHKRAKSISTPGIKALHGDASTVEVLRDPIPSTQLLPRLKVRAHFINFAISSTSELIEQMLHELDQGIEKLGTSPWCWLLDLFESRFTDVHGDTYGTSGLNTFRRDLQHAIGQPVGDQTVFRTHYSVGFSSSRCLPRDEIFAIDRVQHLFLLRAIGRNMYRIVGKCYLWGGMNLDYWNPGSYKGIWTHNPFDLGTEQTRSIEIY
jgi:hypothetical protein